MYRPIPQTHHERTNTVQTMHPKPKLLRTTLHGVLASRPRLPHTVLWYMADMLQVY